MRLYCRLYCLSCQNAVRDTADPRGRTSHTRRASNPAEAIRRTTKGLSNFRRRWSRKLSASGDTKGDRKWSASLFSLKKASAKLGARRVVIKSTSAFSKVRYGPAVHAGVKDPETEFSDAAQQIIAIQRCVRRWRAQMQNYTTPVHSISRPWNDRQESSLGDLSDFTKLKTTKALHQDPERASSYTAPRECLHQKIIRHFVDQNHKLHSTGPSQEDELNPGHGRPLLVLLMGCPGAGKNTCLNKFMELRGWSLQHDFVEVNKDDILAHLPEYWELSTFFRQKSGVSHDWVGLCLGEAGDVAAMIVQHCLKHRLNLIYNGTGKNLDNYQSLARQANKQGFDVYVACVAVDVKVATKRANRRSAETGRFVPESVIKKISNYIVINFQTLIKDPVIYDAVVYNNTGPVGSAHLIWTKKKSKKAIDWPASMLLEKFMCNMHEMGLVDSADINAEHGMAATLVSLYQSSTPIHSTTPTILTEAQYKLACDLIKDG